MKQLPETTTLIVGLGQIGGSIALDLTSRRSVSEVLGYDIEQTTVAEAVMQRVIDRSVRSLETGIKQADLIVLAVPIKPTIEMLPRIAAVLDGRTDALVIDVSSTKGEVCEQARTVGLGKHFVGGHPIAGNEGSGLDAAETNMFSGRSFALTPTAQTTEDSLKLATELVEALGARPVILTPRQHDEFVALTIGIPHVLSLALAQLAGRARERNEPALDLAGGSFRGAIRVAASPPHLIPGMLLTNRNHVARNIRELCRELATLADLVSDADEKHLNEIVHQCRQIAGGFAESECRDDEP